MRLILASASPARLQTLRNAGLAPEVVVSAVDESAYAAASAGELAGLLAEAKAEAVFASLGQPTQTIVIGCDSILDFNGESLGKPGSPEQASALLKRTRGHSGVLVTGHHLIVSNRGNVQRLNRLGTTTVHVANLSDEEVAAYVATGEPEQVAGGFTIDGLGGPFITAIEGDPHNVIGLSLPLLREMLTQVNIPWPTLWTN